MDKYSIIPITLLLKKLEQLEQEAKIIPRFDKSTDAETSLKQLYIKQGMLQQSENIRNFLEKQLKNE